MAFFLLFTYQSVFALGGCTLSPILDDYSNIEMPQEDELSYRGKIKSSLEGIKDVRIISFEGSVTRDDVCPGTFVVRYGYSTRTISNVIVLPTQNKFYGSSICAFEIPKTAVAVLCYFE